MMMDTILIGSGITLILISGCCFFLSDGDMGGGGMAVGLFILVLGLIGVFFLHDKKTTPKSEVVADSTQVKIAKDSIYSVQFIISWKDANEIKCGTNVILKGKTEKSVGDTLTIELK